MSASLVDTTDEDADTVRALGRMAGLLLRLHLDLVDHALNGMLALLNVPMVKRLLSHELADIASVGSEARENHTHMIIDVVHLLLMLGELVGSHLESDQNL